jgi:peptide/nickel transport system permease protein
MVLVLFVVSVLTFWIFVKLPPTDPARRLAGKQSTPEAVAAAKKALGLDQPLLVQYGRFAKGFVPWPGWFLNKQVYFNYGNYTPVRDEIASRFPVTLTLAVGGAICWLAIGIPIGIVSAVRRRSWADRSGMIFALIGVSAPTFWIGYLFLWIFHYKLGWFPGSGLPPGNTMWENIVQGRFVLPWLTIAITSAAFYARMVRGNMLEVLSEDYIRTARAKGLSERKVIYKHGLRASLTPVVTMLGLDFAAMLGGAVITETVFNLPGIGRYAVESIYRDNFPGTMAVTIIAAFFLVVANLVVDVIYAYLDPRVRYT